MVASMGLAGDTSMTKVFVGGLAWETQKESLREHFDRYGEILEAVIIFDKATGRSKGYGFVTFKEAEAAKKACEEATPVINGRRANCNLASLGARRIRSSSPASAAAAAVSQPQQGLVAPKSRVMTPPPLPASAAVPLYYPYAAPPFQHHYHGIPYYVSYGYTPSYVADVGYSRKLSHPGGGSAAGYLPAQFPPASYPAEQAGLLVHGAPLPYYPWYHWQQQAQAVGVPTHALAPATPTAVANVPAVVISKPPPPRPPATVEEVAGCR
ncbi:unnamed protein product [Spirodela intermedia]|uniref:RRM domain-containing protein n=1 Tax=Spirodela intermedia TaxID=51605 RepID=A0A7I8JZR6_SPIIN|nr:unnamed protein product [Spirodela intermedia]